MGIFDGLFDSGMGQNGKDENGLEITYTGGDLRHLNEDSKYGYDAKIESDKDDKTHYYSSDNDWKTHSHDISDKNGNYLDYHRSSDEEPDKHPWTDKRHYACILDELSRDELIALKESLNNVNCLKLQRKM